MLVCAKIVQVCSQPASLFSTRLDGQTLEILSVREKSALSSSPSQSSKVKIESSVLTSLAQASHKQSRETNLTSS